MHETNQGLSKVLRPIFNTSFSPSGNLLHLYTHLILARRFEVQGPIPRIGDRGNYASSPPVDPSECYATPRENGSSTGSAISLSTQVGEVIGVNVASTTVNCGF